MAEPKLFAYASRLSVRPGDPLDVMVAAEGVTAADAQLVRLIHGDSNPTGPGYVEEEIDAGCNGTIAVRRQYTQLGSHAVVDDADGRLSGAEAFTLTAWIHPTLVGHGRQAVIGTYDVSTAAGWALGLDRDGHLEFWIGDGTHSDRITTELPLVAGTWYRVAVSHDPRNRRVSLGQRAEVSPTNSVWGPAVPYDHDSLVTGRMRRRLRPSGRPLLWSGVWDHNPERGVHVRWLYNGKIEHPVITRGARSARHLLDEPDHGTPAAEGDAADIVADWNGALDLAPAGVDDTIRDHGPQGLHAHGFNKPVRAMTGHDWDGRHDCWFDAPEQFGAIYFADSSLTDCGWEPTMSLTVPELRSGCYAIRLRARNGGGEAEEYAPFFVRATKPSAPVAFQVPTASYLAYANEHLAFDVQVAQSITAHTPVLQPSDVEMYRNPEFGLSTYDHHSDHVNGVCYSGWRRPIFNMRPKHRTAAIGIPWQFPADLSIVGWLDQQPVDYEIITDHDVHREGLALLSQYRVVITGTHPEYYSAEMLDATERFVADGGRFMYLGGNGLYWVTSFTDDGDTIEVRKLEGGTRAWQARPGEYFHATDGVRGGVWKNRGRGPHKVTGVGFASEGMDRSHPFRRLPASHDAEVAWIFDGVEGDVFGDHGLAHGGAAGIEIDRYDRRFGTPAHTRLLATSEGFSDGYPLVIEEVLTNVPGLAGTSSPLVRGDVTYTTTNAAGGAVFCTGSIAWGQALPTDDYDNDIARITGNLVTRFADPEPLPHLGDPLDDRQIPVVEDWRARHERSLAGLVDAALLAEYAAAPLGPSSDRLLRVLDASRGRDDGVVIEEIEPFERYALVVDGEAVSAHASVDAAMVAAFEVRTARMATNGAGT